MFHPFVLDLSPQKSSSTGTTSSNSIPVFLSSFCHFKSELSEPSTLETTSKQVLEWRQIVQNELQDFNSTVSLPMAPKTPPQEQQRRLLQVLSSNCPTSSTCSNCSRVAAKTLTPILPCQHLLCEKCINTLINSSANVPRGKMECGLCGVAVQRIGGPGPTSLEFTLAKENQKPAVTMKVLNQPPSLITIVNRLLTPIPVYSIRIDNIPWDISSYEILQFLALPRNTSCFVHVIADRKTCQTFSQCYVDLTTLEHAQDCVKRLDSKRIAGHRGRYVKGDGGRPVSVSLCAAKEVMEELFYNFQRGFGDDVLFGITHDSDDDVFGHTTSEIIKKRELDNLLEFCTLKTPHARKMPERPYMNIVSIVLKFPWHLQHLYNDSKRDEIFNALYRSLELLMVHHKDVISAPSLFRVAVDVGFMCPTFTNVQKSHLYEISDTYTAFFPIDGSVLLPTLTINQRFAPPPVCKLMKSNSGSSLGSSLGSPPHSLGSHRSTSRSFYTTPANSAWSISTTPSSSSTSKEDASLYRMGMHSSSPSKKQRSKQGLVKTDSDSTITGLANGGSKTLSSNGLTAKRMLDENKPIASRPRALEVLEEEDEDRENKVESLAREFNLSLDTIEKIRLAFMGAASN